jgi:V8-like Glu-specific endopeptidase
MAESNLSFAKFNSSDKRPVPESDHYRLAIAKLDCFAPNNANPVGYATGVFITKDVLLTVGHAVFDREAFQNGRDGYADHLKISSPWYAIPLNAVATNRVVAAPGWVDQGLAGFDLGMVRLNAPVPGIATMAPHALNDAQLANIEVRFYGFPAGLSHLYCGDGACVGFDSGRIFHTADAGPGESGSPLAATVSGVAVVIGLHRAGTGESPARFSHAVSAVRINSAALQWISDMLPQI